MRVILLLAPCCLALLFTACPQSGHKPALRVATPPTGNTIKSAAGEPAVADPGPGQGAAKTAAVPGAVDTGSTAPAALPEGWPDTLPAYPGASIKMAQSIGSGNTAALNVVLATKAAAQDVLRYYGEKAQAAGFTNTLQVNTKDGGGMYRYESQSQVFSVTAVSDAAGTTVTMLLSRK